MRRRIYLYLYIQPFFGNNAAIIILHARVTFDSAFFAFPWCEMIYENHQADNIERK